MVPFSVLFKEVCFTIQIEFKGSPFNYSISDFPIEMNFGTILDYKNNPTIFSIENSNAVTVEASNILPFNEMSEEKNLHLTSVTVNYVNNKFPIPIGVCFKDDSKIEVPGIEEGYNMTIFGNSTTVEKKSFADERVAANNPQFIKRYCGCKNLDELTAGLDYKIVEGDVEKMSIRDPELAMQFLSLEEITKDKKKQTKYVFVKKDQTYPDHALLREIEKLPRGIFVNYRKIKSSNNMSDEEKKCSNNEIETGLLDESYNPLVVGVEEFSIPYDRFSDYIEEKWDIISTNNKSGSLRDFKISIHNLVKNNSHASKLWKLESALVDDDRNEYSIMFNITVKCLIKQERNLETKYYVC